MSDNEKKQSNPRDEILLQLHKQYAINNNANLSTVMTLVVALIAVIGYYGYIFVHTTNEYRGTLDCLYNACCKYYYMEALLLVYCASILILGILFCICTYQGIAQRKEQFIIYAIRDEYDIKTGSILPNGYEPFNKKGLEVIQGLYGELVKIFFWVAGILTLLTGYRTIPISDIHICCVLCITLVLLIGSFFYNYNKYKKICNTQNSEQSDQTHCGIGAYVWFTVILILMIVLTFVCYKIPPCSIFMFPIIVVIFCFNYFIKQYLSYLKRKKLYKK